MKRILVVVDNLNKGGIASVALNISNALSSKEYVFDYITFKLPNEKVMKELKLRNSNFFVVKRLSETTLIKFIKEVRKIIKENGPYDVMHAHTSSFIWISCLAAKLENIPIRVGHAHGSKNAKEFVFSNIVYSSLRIMNRKLCTTMLACSKASGEYVFGKNYTFVPNFVDHEKYKALEDIEKKRFLDKYRLSEFDNNICFVGYLGGEKNPRFALTLFSQLENEYKNINLLIAGDGPEYSSIKEGLEKTDLIDKVIMFGNTEEVKEILNVSSILIMPSFSEGMSIAAIEAQISGVHCIVSKGVPDTNDIGAGLFHKIESYNEDEWCKKVMNIIRKEDRPTYERTIEALNRLEYDKSSVIKKIKKAYS